MPYQAIIEKMFALNKSSVIFKIVPDGSDFIIGSNSKNDHGDYYTLHDEIFLIDKMESRLNKRGFDIAASMILLFTLPVNLWFVKNVKNYIKNIFKVLSGSATWVGYSDSQENLPVIRRILCCGDELKTDDLDIKTFAAQLPLCQRLFDL